MIIQQQIQEAVRSRNGLTAAQSDLQSGWAHGLQIIQRASANARYFQSAGPQVPVDVSWAMPRSGCIDFYGRFQNQAIRVTNAATRLQYFTPTGGSSVGVDPSGCSVERQTRSFKNVHRVRALLEGQKLWTSKSERREAQ